MFDLLTKEVHEDRDVVYVRDRVFDVLNAIGCSTFQASRTATELSALLRQMVDVSRPVVLELKRLINDRFLISIEATTEALDRGLTHIGAWTTSPWTRRHFQTGERLCAEIATPATCKELDMDEVKALANFKTRKDLLVDLQRSNQALEFVVERRTAELSAALQEALAAGRAKSQFLSHMSHELRTPLHGVLGYVQILLGSQDSTPEQTKWLNSIQSCGQHLLELINTVLDLAKFEAGNSEATFAPCNLRKLCEDCGSIIRGSASRKGLEVDVRIGPEVPTVSMTDETRMKQVLVNLLGNACKFTEQGSIGIILSRTGNNLEYCVWDTGPGMGPDDLELAEKPFQQGDAGLNKGGTGLGITISKAIAELLGGSLDVESELGKGTRVKLLVPFKESTDGAVRQPPPSLPDEIVLHGASDVRVLIVDDSLTNREVLSGFLSSFGVVFEVADSGRSAIDLASHREFDLVLCDYRMDDMSGPEVLRTLRGMPGYADTPIVACTADTRVSTGTWEQEGGFNAVIKKPFSKSTVAEALIDHCKLSWSGDQPIHESASRERKAHSGASPQLHLQQALDRVTNEIAVRVVDTISDAVSLGDLSAVEDLANNLLNLEGDARDVAQILLEMCDDLDLDGLQCVEERPTA